MNAATNPTKTNTQFSVVRLTRPNTAPWVRQTYVALRACCLPKPATPSPYLVIDLSAVQYFGGACWDLGVNLGRTQEARSAHGTVWLTPYCAKLILNLKLNRLLDIVPTQQDAFDKLQLAACPDGKTHGPGIRLEKSDAAWGPGLVSIDMLATMAAEFAQKSYGRRWKHSPQVEFLERLSVRSQSGLVPRMTEEVDGLSGRIHRRVGKSGDRAVHYQVAIEGNRRSPSDLAGVATNWLEYER